MPKLKLTKAQKTEIAARFRELRGHATQVEFAEKLGLDQQHVSRYESGAALPAVASLHRYCEKLSVTSDWILFGRGSKYRRK